MTNHGAMASCSNTIPHQMKHTSHLGSVARKWIHRRSKKERRISAGSNDGNVKKIGDLHSQQQPLATPSTQQLRLFVGTWNVGGRAPRSDTRESVHEWLIGCHETHQDERPDLYVIGFQEIVPLNVGNVLKVSTDGENTRGLSRSDMWEALINETLNKTSRSGGCTMNHNEKNPSSIDLLKMHNMDMPTIATKQSPQIVENDSKKRSVSQAHSCMSRIAFYELANCNMAVEKNNLKDVVIANTLQNGFSCETQLGHEDCCHNTSSLPPNDILDGWTPLSRVPSHHKLKFPFQDLKETPNVYRFSRIARKQMVGLFITIWVRQSLRPHIKDVQVTSVGCGIMNQLGNKGSVSIRLSVHETSFCFVCSHLRSGDAVNDVIRRNVDIENILHRTRFPCFKRRNSKFSLQPQKTILAHDRIILLGDLNYRLNITPAKLKALILQQDWRSLFNKDELKIAKGDGGVLEGWQEGSISFAPTYKYLVDSDAYYWMEEGKHFSKRRAPAWCDRILWHGKGLNQLSYTRCESKHSDHRPVKSIFMVEVEVLEKKSMSIATNQSITTFMEEEKELFSTRRLYVKRFSLR